MAVDTPYTTSALINRLAGELAIDLRTDDGTEATLVADAIDAGTVEVDYYMVAYAIAGVAADVFCQQAATYFACRYLCERRFNEVPAGLQKACERFEGKLERIRTRKARVRIARARRPGVVTNHIVWLRDWNNQNKVDANRSTGVAKDYKRPTDDSSPDCR